MHTRFKLTAKLGALAGVAALTLGLAACSSSAESETPEGNAEVPETTIVVGSAPSLSGLGIASAIASGAFDDSGLIVTSTPNRSANEAVPQLLNGGIQVAQMDTLTFMQAHAQGIPVKIIAAAGIQSSDGEAGVMSAASVVAKADSDVEAIEDLEGRRVGVPALKTQTWMNIRASIDAAGGDSSKVEFIEVPPAQIVDLIIQGEIEAGSPNEPLASSAIAGGTVKLVNNTDAPGNYGVPS